jgi:hypothetical protein
MIIIEITIIINKNYYQLYLYFFLLILFAHHFNDNKNLKKNEIIQNRFRYK